METEDTQRRRIVLALLVTAVLVPAYFLLERAQSDSPTATSAAPESTGAPAEIRSEDVLGTLPLGYLEAPTDDDSGDTPTIVIPESVQVLTTRATFNRDIGAVTSCLVPGAPREARVTVTNTDNGLSVACDNVLDPADYAERAFPDQAILHIVTYETIADLTDAPVPIEARW